MLRYLLLLELVMLLLVRSLMVLYSLGLVVFGLSTRYALYFSDNMCVFRIMEIDANVSFLGGFV